MITYTVTVDEDITRWYLNGQYHREDGPAIEWADGTKYWCLNGKRHRTDGPAIETFSGDKYWYLNDEYLTEAEFNAKMNPVKELTELETAQGDLATAKIAYAAARSKTSAAYINYNKVEADTKVLTQAAYLDFAKSGTDAANILNNMTALSKKISALVKSK